MAGAFVSDPLEHLVRKVDLDGRPMEGVLVLEPLEHSVLDVSLDGGPMEGNLDLEPLEHSVSEEDQTGRPMEGDFGLEPLEHSILDVNLDSRPRQDELDSGPLEHSVPDHAPSRGAVLFEKLSVSDPLDHSGLIASDDVVPKSAPSEPLKHSVHEGPQSWGAYVYTVSKGALRVTTLSTSVGLSELVSFELSVDFSGLCFRTDCWAVLPPTSAGSVYGTVVG